MQRLSLNSKTNPRKADTQHPHSNLFTQRTTAVTMRQSLSQKHPKTKQKTHLYLSAKKVAH